MKRMTKKILITGKDSYIGKSFIEYCQEKKYDIKIEELDIKNNDWEEFDFSSYNAIFHVAGIAHQNRKDISDELYYKVNCDLAIKVAEKAKKNGVKQFIFMSSMIVYGESKEIGNLERITRNTMESPINAYGDSKLQADIKLQKLSDNHFNVANIRPPMIYGPGSKGNFPLLKKFAQTSPVFPDIKNIRSMLYIENLSEFVYQIIQREVSGLFFPQNKEYVCTSNMVSEIACQSGQKISLTKAFNPLLKSMSGSIKLVDKVFGNFYYDMEISRESFDYQLVDFEESVYKSIFK